MREFVLTIGVAALFTACASSPTAYGPATSNSRIGFENTKIESDRFRIRYTARSDEEAHNFVLLRAAQIAIDENYTHFKILNGDVFGNGPRSPVATSIGLGTGRHYGRSRTNVGVGVDVLDVARALEGDKVTHAIEVRLLNGAAKAPDVYEAQSIVDSIRPATFKP